MQEATGVSVGADARETLKVLALDGALDESVKVSCSALGDRLGVSTQTASRRLQALESADLIEREIVSDGQVVSATPAGERTLQREYDDYRRIFEGDRDISLSGRVTGGMGEGKHYISLSGYMRQFEEKLGYAPFEGTLNVDLDEESVRARGVLDRIDPIHIEGWEDDERTYGPAFCWPVTVEAGDETGGAADGTDGAAGDTYEPAHLITPERTHHGEDQAELIAPDRLRDELGLADGDEITITIADADANANGSASDGGA